MQDYKDSVITSVNNDRIKDFVKLKQKKYRDAEQMFIVEGYHLIQEAAKVNLLDTVLTTKEDSFVEGVNNILVNSDIISKLSSTVAPQNIIGIVRYFNKEETGASKILLLDNIQDPGNMGTIIRTALAFGIEKIIASPDTVDFYNEKVIRASQGSIFSIPLFKKDLKEEIVSLKEKQIVVIAAELEGAVNIKDFKVSDSYALLLGNEGQGVKNELLKLCDKTVKIAIKDIDSLNVAIACAIILWVFETN